MADVAQLVEPRIVIPVVEGSIPFIRPIINLTSYFMMCELAFQIKRINLQIIFSDDLILMFKQ